MKFDPGFAEVEGSVAAGGLPLEWGRLVWFAFGVRRFEGFGAVKVGGGEFEADAYEAIGVAAFGVFVFENIIH